MSVRRVAGIAPRYNNGLVTGTCRYAVDHVAVPARHHSSLPSSRGADIQTHALLVSVTVSEPQSYVVTSERGLVSSAHILVT